MASSSEGKNKSPEEADSSSPKAMGEEQGNNATVQSKPEPKKKKKKMVRFTQQQIDCWIAAGEPVLPKVNTRSYMEGLSAGFLAKLPQDIRDSLAKIDAGREAEQARRDALQEELRKERQDVLDQYYSKGYAEYEIDEEDEDDEDEVAPARDAGAAGRGRRRFRPGIVKRRTGRSTKKLN